MTFKIEYQIKKEEIPIDENETQKIEMLNIKIHTSYPNHPIEIKLDDNTSFGTQTNDKGVAICSVSGIKDYHVTVDIAGETFEEKITI